MAPTTRPPDSDPPPGGTLPPISYQAEDGAPARRPLAAGHVIVVGLVALLVGALLNAPGIRKTALGQPVGWQRDISTAFANPLYDVSHALYLDRLREGLKDLLGRSSDDSVNSHLPSPTTVPPGPTPTTLPPRLAFTPAHPLRLWIGGDSLGDTPGSSLIDQLSSNQAVGILGPVDTHISTGLARPEVFNWPAFLQDGRDHRPTRRGGAHVRGQRRPEPHRRRRRRVVRKSGLAGRVSASHRGPDGHGHRRRPVTPSCSSSASRR